jgi:transposase-like protein
MARSYAPEFRRRVVELVRSCRSVAVVSAEIGVSEATVYRWRAQDRIDRGEQPGLSSVERSELARARRRIRELETELEITKKASALFAAGQIRPKEVSGDCFPGRVGLRDRALLPHPRRRIVRVLQLARVVTDAERAPAGVAARADQPDPRRLARRVRLPARARRAAARPADRRLEEARASS